MKSYDDYDDLHEPKSKTKSYWISYKYSGQRTELVDGINENDAIRNLIDEAEIGDGKVKIDVISVTEEEE